MTSLEAKLRKAAEELGVSVIVDTFENLKELGFKIHECPFDIYLGICFPNYLILESHKGFEYPYTIGAAIHEMGHLICTKSTDDDTEEYIFFGWEFAVARKYDLMDPWLDSSSNYTIDGNHDFGAINKDEQSDVLEEVFQISQEHGFINPNGEPIGLL